MPASVVMLPRSQHCWRPLLQYGDSKTVGNTIEFVSSQTSDNWRSGRQSCYCKKTRRFHWSD